MDWNQLMQVANQVREQLGQSQAEAAKLRLTGEAGGGMVRVVLNGRHEAIEVTIDEQVFRAGDKALLEDLVRAAYNQAAEKVGAELRTKLGGLAQGLGLDLGALGLDHDRR